MTDERRRACVQLLRTVLDLRVLVENNNEYHGKELPARLAEIRKCVAATEVQATELALIATTGLAQAAEQLAEAARGLVKAAAESASPQLGALTNPTDLAEFNERVKTFREMAVADRRATFVGQIASRPPRGTEGAGG